MLEGRILKFLTTSQIIRLNLVWNYGLQQHINPIYAIFHEKME